MKYRFGSREWMAAAHGVFMQRASCLARQGHPERVSLCEIYRNTPAEFGWENNEVAWSCVFENGAVEFDLAERDDVSFKASGDYAAFHTLSTYAIEGDPDRAADYAKLVKVELDAGRIKVHCGNGYKEPGDLEALHDVLARIAE